MNGKVIFNHRITDIGESIHQYYVTEFQKEKDECIQAATEEAWTKADLEIEKMVLQTIKFARKERDVLKKRAENACAYIQVTLAEYDMKVKRKVMSDIEKLRKRNEERYSQEIRVAVEKIAHRKASSEVLAKRKDKNLNTQTATILERDFMLQPQHAKTVANQKKDEILEKVKAVMASSIAGNIEKTQKEEQKIAQQNLNMVEKKYKAELTALKERTRELEAVVDKTARDLQTAIADKQVYVDDLEETRAAFLNFINLQFKDLRPDQADFILPPKKTDRK
ncbi:uncharacterized protein C6orf163 homolog [Osmerus eperlanus]|uniref:uncharacterized protein C6orf163 homolog n=1 Tax=Osmerus eperlanus TaxID=29151 RepID=UPI002E0FBA37